MKNIPVLFLSFGLIMLSCSPQVSTNYIEKIMLQEAFENRKSIAINDISTNFEYVRLETKDDCLTGTRLTVYAKDQYLIAIDREKILLFGRKDGKFIREVGNKGNGPCEYSRTYNVMPINEEKNIIYAGRNKKRYGYSPDGKLVDTLPIPELVSEIGNLDESIYAAFMPDYQGGETRKLLIFDQKDSLLNTFPNYLSAPKTMGIFVWNPNSWFYKQNKKLFFYQLFNDTVFHVDINSLAPKYVIDMGIYSPPYEMKTSPEFVPGDYYIVKTIQESSKYLFCSFNFNNTIYMAMYDKNSRTTIVNDLVNDVNPETGHGFIRNKNDFVPLEYSSINEKDELICTMNAYIIKQWFDLNPDKADQLPEELKALKNIEETSNPIVIIAKLKR